MTCHLPRFIILSLALLATFSAHARIGESQSTIQDRITSGNRGLVVDDEELVKFYLNQTPLKAVVMTTNDRGDMVVHDNLNLSVVVYYKTIAGERAYESRLTQKNGKPVPEPEGWLLYVVYYKGRSVLELYTRSGSITQSEINGLLSLNQGGANWVDMKLPEDKYPSKDYKPVLPHNIYRSDIELLAQRGQNNLMIFDLDIDDHLSKAKTKRESEDAPDSLAGF